ncbi:hypothetical protein [Kineosporia sp. A_224]|uniref:hypothetical protein n=1 Tax=Kineosporia sp. A_224 TaxID=1962180 RepID=UPI000B4B9ECD
MADAYLASLAALADRATPGPWRVRLLDDEWAMNLVAVGTAEDTGQAERCPGFDHSAIVAATLVQQPRYVDIADERWDENAAFIAAARTAVPELLAEIARLRALVRQSRLSDTI